MKRPLVMTLGFLIFASVASAQETVQLTVDEAVRRAVEHNPDRASVRFGTQVEAARVSESEIVWLVDWKVALSLVVR